jgi:multidrug efflux system membrane fusion protein
MYVDFSISENEFPQVYGYFKQQRQLSCEVSPIAHPQVKAMAQLELVDNQVLKQSGNVKLRAIFSNENFTFWAGESARIRLILTTMKNAVLAPDVAVNTNQAGHFIFVVNGESRAEVRPVVLGQAHGTDVVVREGLKKGDRVIVAGQFLLAPQTHVVVAGELIPSAPAADKATDRTSAKPSADHRSVNSQDEQKKSQTANGSPLPALSNEKNFRAADKNSPGQITRALPGDEQR